MNTPHVCKTLYIDALDLAHSLEFELGPYLTPVEEDQYSVSGLWKTAGPNSAAPSLSFTGASMTPTRHLRQEARRIDQNTPVERSMRMIEEMIAWQLKQHAHYLRPVKVVSPGTITDVEAVFAAPEHPRFEEPAPVWTPIREYFQTSRDPAKDYRNQEQLLVRATDLLLDMRTGLTRFLGDDHWVLHYYSRQGMDFLVEKTVDFRIYDWERRMRSGEWSQS